MATACPVKNHLWRGLAGGTLLVMAGFIYTGVPELSLPVVALSAVFLRGCPACWSFGLYEAMRDKKRIDNTPLQQTVVVKRRWFSHRDEVA